MTCMSLLAFWLSVVHNSEDEQVNKSWWFGVLVTKWSEVIHSCPTLAIPWTVAHQAPLSLGFSRWEYCSGLPFPSPDDFPNPGIEPQSPASQADSLPTEIWGSPNKF